MSGPGMKTFRRFISQRRPSRREEEYYEDDSISWQDDISVLKSATKPQKRRIRVGTKKPLPQPIVAVRHHEDIHRIGIIPPLPSPPRSSQSSLSSFEGGQVHTQNNGDLSPPRSSRSGIESPPLYTSASKEDLAVGSYPSGLAKEGRLLSRQSPPSSRDGVDSLLDSSEPMSDFNEILLLPMPNDGEQASLASAVRRQLGCRNKPLPDTPPDEAPVQYSDRLELEQFSRATEEAFRLEIPLNEAELSKFCDRRPEVVEEVKSPIASPDLDEGRAQPESPVKPISPPPARPMSIVKQASPKSKNKRGRRRTAYPKQPSLWGFSENARELIGRFQRIEADEMLSAEEIKEFSRMRRESQWQQPKKAIKSAEAKRSVETASTSEAESSDTSTEPFHMQDLPRKINAAGLRFSSLPSPIAEVDTPCTAVFNPDVMRADFSLPQQESKTSPTAVDNESAEPREHLLPIQATNDEDDDDDDEDEDSNMPLPSPPPKSPARFQSQKNLPPIPINTTLPSIPELMGTSPSEMVAISSLLTLTPTSQRSPATTKTAPVRRPDEHVFLPGTPFSLHAPGFRHGPIRLAKADLQYHLEADRQTAAAAAVAAAGAADNNDALDWTAFQMAILGGAGDLFGEAVDYGHQDDGDRLVIEDLCSWFDSFGFDGPGTLVDATNKCYYDERQRQLRRKRASRNNNSSGSSFGSITRASPKSKSGSLRDSLGSHRSADRGSDPSVPATEPIGDVTEITGSGRRSSNANTRRAEAGSPPRQNARLSLVVNRDVKDREYVVSMGSSFGHDLGDFLKWEAENVAAVGFYGTN